MSSPPAPAAQLELHLSFLLLQSQLFPSAHLHLLKLTFVVEPVNPVDTGTFVVSSEDEKVFRVLDLVGQQEADGLERLFPSIDVVSEEEVVGFRRLWVGGRARVGVRTVERGGRECWNKVSERKRRFRRAWRGKEGKGTTHETSVLEQPQEIVVLSVDISAHLYGCFQLEKDRLRDED